MRVLVALSLVLLACDDRADRRAERLEDLAETIEGRLAPLALVEVPHAERWAIGDRRVVVGDAIAIDRAALALQLYRAEPEGYAESARPIPTAGTVVALGPHRMPAGERAGTIGALADALHEPAPGQMGESPRDVGGMVDLVIDGDTPYATVATVLQTVVSDGRHPQLVVTSDGERAVLPLRFPPAASSCRGASCITALQEAREMPTGERADQPTPGLGLTLVIDERGVDVFGTGGALEPGCERVRSSTGPTVPRTGGALNGPAIETCLQAIADVFPDDDELWIQPEPRTPFAEVALVASLALGPAGERFPELRFARPVTRR